MPPPNDRSALRDIEHCAGLILDVTVGKSESEFVGDWVLVAAVERQMGIIGEAVKRLTPEFRAEHPTVDWRGWAGLRDILVHAYDTVDEVALWEVVAGELERFRELVLGFLGENFPSQS